MNKAAVHVDLKVKNYCGYFKDAAELFNRDPFSTSARCCIQAELTPVQTFSQTEKPEEQFSIQVEKDFHMISVEQQAGCELSI